MVKTQASGTASGVTVLSISASFPVLPAVGSFIFVPIHKYSPGDFEVGEVTDNQGNTYILAVRNRQSTPAVAIYYCPNVLFSSGTFTITYTFVALGNGWFKAEEWADMNSATVVQTAVGEAVSGSDATSGTTVNVIPGIDGALVVAAASGVFPSVTGFTVESVIPAWAEVARVDSPFFAPQGISNARVVTDPGTQTCNWTAPDPDWIWAACIVVFAPAVVTPPELVIPTLMQRASYVFFSNDIVEKQVETRLTRTYLQLLAADTPATPAAGTLNLTEVTGDVYDSNGVLMTTGRLYIKPKGIITLDDLYLFGTETIVYDVTGSLSINLAPSATVTYTVEFDPDLTDPRPRNLKTGYWKNIWTIPDTGTVDISDL